ncbi:MAG: glycosyltransferase family 4 protein [Thiomicrospira sp.]|nr:glycosyltransferase family 4 protein [Thiomicrospira sp.]
MRIAYDYQTFVLQNYGGISRYFTCLAQGLIDLQQQVKIFAPLHRNRYVGALPLGTVIGREFVWFPPKTKRTIQLLSAYNHTAAMKMIANWQPDIVHETYYSRFSSAPKNYPTVITVYDMIHELFYNEFSARDNTSELKKTAVARADHVICISENSKQDLIRIFGTPASKISVILLGFDAFCDQRTVPVAESTNARPFLLYVGSRRRYKNFARFLKSVAASKKLLSDYDVIAFGGGEFSAVEMALIQSLGFTFKQVRQITGNDALLGDYYSTASAFVYPSLYEGFGIPPLEAMAHQCPVIASNTSSMPEVIGDAAEFFNPFDVDEMCFAIEAVVYSESRMDDLRKKGLARLAHFSWKKCAQETLAVYQTLLGKY